MYNPPPSDDIVWNDYREAYDLGYQSARQGKDYENPYKESGHERDTTFSDELHYHYYVGFEDGLIHD